MAQPMPCDPSVLRGAPGSAGVPPARAEGPQWTTRRRPTDVEAGGTPALPGNPVRGEPRGNCALNGGRAHALSPGPAAHPHPGAVPGGSDPADRGGELLGLQRVRADPGLRVDQLRGALRLLGHVHHLPGDTQVRVPDLGLHASHRLHRRVLPRLPRARSQVADRPVPDLHHPVLDLEHHPDDRLDSGARPPRPGQRRAARARGGRCADRVAAVLGILRGARVRGHRSKCGNSSLHTRAGLSRGTQCSGSGVSNDARARQRPWISAVSARADSRAA